MLVTQIDSSFRERRLKILKNHPQAVFLLPSNPEFLRNPDVTYPYRQESNFYYLSGFTEAHSFMILAQGKSILFVHPRDEMKEIWEGEMYGVERAKSIFQFDEAYSIEELEKKLPDFFQNATSVYYSMGFDSKTDALLTQSLKTYKNSLGRSGEGFLPIQDLKSVLGEMRLFKEPKELEWIRFATEASAKAHTQIINETHPGMNEGEIRYLMEYYFKKNGCQDLGYGTIVAGGANACCLHYRACNDVLKENELLLIDAGGEYNYYSADITRTFPISKKFTAEQKVIYELVLKANEEVMQMVKPGLPYAEMHVKATRILADGLIQLKLLKGSVDEAIETGAIKKYYPHGTGHYLGLDVHDVGLYQTQEHTSPSSGKHEKLKRTPRPLEPGMFFTIEPGLYFQKYHTEIPENFRGIGIRIEDNILVTQNGYENLTEKAPKKVSEIEELKN